MGNQINVRIVPSAEIDTTSSTTSKRHFALAIIDVQNDFCAGGALAVKDADLVIGPINKLRFMYYEILPTFISQDYHPANHMSFNTTHKVAVNTKQKLCLQMDDGSFIDVEQDMWPVHCVQNTPGSKIHQDLIVTKTDKIIKKGTKSNVESYSAFGDQFGGKYEKTDLDNWLKSQNVTDIILTGIATDYCVYNTALDARRNGYNVHLIMSCTRGVAEDTTKSAIHDMTAKGVLFYDTVDNFYNLYKEEIIYSVSVRK
jgi:nicotinamidase/pyrazinamidase